MLDHPMLHHYSNIPNAKFNSPHAWKAHLAKKYNTNDHGYRSDPFEHKDINVASIGCSNVLGWAIEVEERFSTIFCNKLASKTGKTVSDWNFGIGGKSNDYIARIVASCQRSLKPDVYLISFTGLGRREYWTHAGECIDYVPSNFPEFVKKFAPETFEINKKIHLLTSEWDNVNNFIRNFKMIEAELKNVTWYYTFSSGEERGGTTSQSIANLIPQNNYIGYFHSYDLATDGRHPGPKSHKDLADRFLKCYLDKFVSQSHVERTDKVIRYI